ncbi:MAG TPA: tyrosine-type recombinase/integrase [Longilinea sp.]|nr:tyrosine-type recombinase/integrase [Longilinea sp.]
MYNSKVGDVITLKDSIESVLESFITERQAKGLSHNTLLFYKRECTFFMKWLWSQGVFDILLITSQLIREYFLDLAKRRNKGGVHASYRAIKALLLYYENEFEPTGYKNPIHKVHVKPNHINPLKGIAIEDVYKLVDVCNGRFKLRDKAIFLFLVSSGVRAAELLNMNLQDVDTVTGQVKVISGKGDKNRYTYINKDARKALRRFLLTHPANVAALWLNGEGERLTKSGIDHLLVKYAKLAGIPTVGAHVLDAALR